MKLARQTPTNRRRLLSACAGHPASPMTPVEKHRLYSLLLNPRWAPTPEDTPVAFGAVEAWYDDLQGPMGGWVQTLRKGARR